MKNFIQQGDVISFTAAANLTSGQGLLLGTLFGIVVNTVVSGAPAQLKTTGCFDLAKTASQAWTVGAKIYWDDTNKVLTTTSTSNTLVGHAILAVGSGSGETIGRIRLLGGA